MNSHIGLPPFLFDSPDKKIIAWRFYYILVSPQKFIAYPQPHEILKCPFNYGKEKMPLRSGIYTIRDKNMRLS